MTRLLVQSFKIIGIFAATLTFGGPFLPIPIDRLSSDAEAIVHGTVIGKSVQTDAEGRIYTKVQLDVKDVWKGNAVSSPFTVVHSGGILGKRWATAEGEVSYRMGEEVVVFLVINRRGEGVTMGMQQGKFLVQHDKYTNRNYVRNLFHGGKPPSKDDKKGYRFPTRLPLTVESLKRQVSRYNS